MGSSWTGVAGKRVLITGATSGIGLAAARELARRGARLSIVARTDERAREAAREIKNAAGGEGVADIDVLMADLSSQSSVRHLAAEVLERYPKLDVLVNNAGAVYTRRQVTDDGIELTWAVNHLAPFLLSTLLLTRLQESAPARIVTTSSGAHQGARIPFDDLSGERSFGPGGFARYGATKLANILFTVELARRLDGTAVTATCFHPGFVGSGFARNNGRLLSAGMLLVRPFARSPEKGAETLVWLADSPEVDGQSGGYYVDKQRVLPSRAGQDMQVAHRLWQVSEEQTRQSADHPAS